MDVLNPNYKKEHTTRLRFLSMHRGIWPLLLFFAIGMVAACSEDEIANVASGGATEELEIQAAQAGAAANIANAAKSVIGGVGGSSTSAAIQTVLDGLGIVIPPSANPADPTAELENQLGDALALIFQDGVKNGNTITFTPDQDKLNAFCADPSLGGLAALLASLGSTQTCLDFYAHMVAVLTQGANSDEGTVDFKYDDFILTRIGYSLASVFFEADLAQGKSIVQAMFSQGFIPDPAFPDTFEGVFRSTLMKLGEGDVDHGSFTQSIEQAINIVGSGNNLNIAAAPNVFGFEANGPAGTLSADIGLGAVSVITAIEDALLVDHPTTVSLNAATGHLDLTATQLIFSNVGLGTSPFTINATEAGSPGVDFSFGLTPFGFTIDSTDDSVTFNTPYNSDFEIADVFELFPGPGGPIGPPGFTGTTNLAIPDGSKWTVQGNSAGETLLLNSGANTTTITGTGDFLAASANFLANACFTLRASFGFPLMPAACI